jgi:NOL1/NOP2/fmu family ribosome biogenesis protein
VKNLACWGSSNSCITGEQPEKLLEACGPCFDRILVDAPCSGEGMFRRDAGLISAWTERGPQAYADTQKRILDCAVQMLRPGGILAYSTCTFSEEEDEEVICHTLQMHPELSLIPAASCEGFAEGRTPFEACLRLWPHRIQGEGHFFALLQKAEGGTDHRLRAYTGAELRQSHRRMPQEMASFLEKIPQSLWQDRKYEQIGEQCMLLPPYHLPQKLRYLRTGIWAGTCKKGRFEPSPALALLLGRKDYPSVLDLSSGDERVIRYLKGETLDLTDEEERTVDGWTLVCTDGFGLGWGKAAGGRLKNKYYPGWRLL